MIIENNEYAIIWERYTTEGVDNIVYLDVFENAELLLKHLNYITNGQDNKSYTRILWCNKPRLKYFMINKK